MAINLVKKSILFLLFVVSLSYSAFEDQNLSIDKPISKAAISESSSLNLLKCDHILDLPEPILREIFLNLQDNHLDIIRFAQTCKRANEIVQNAHIPLTIYASTYKNTGIFTPANARRIRTLVIGTELNSFPPSDVPNQYTWNDLLSHTQLRSLSITHHQLEATFFSNLFSQCPHLQSLVLNNCTVGEDVWENLARLLPSTGIRCLNLNLNHAGYPKKDTFIKILPHTQITTFKIPLTSSEKKVFMSVLPHTQISSLDIELREVEELTELANTLPDTKINNLTIRFSRYGSLRDNKKGGLFALSSFADGFSRTKITSITMRGLVA